MPTKASARPGYVRLCHSVNSSSPYARPNSGIRSVVDELDAAARAAASVPNRRMTARNSSGRYWRRMSASRSILPPSTRPSRSPSAIPPISIGRFCGDEGRVAAMVAVSGESAEGRGPSGQRRPGSAAPADRSSTPSRGTGMADHAVRVLRDQRDRAWLDRAAGVASRPRPRCVRTNASTTLGSNWMPANLRSSPSACSAVSGVIRYGRWAVIASNASATWRIACEQRDLVADQPVRVARAVVPLVVVADDRQLARQPRDRRR